MRYKLVGESIIKLGSIKSYDVSKSSDLIELVNHLNEVKSERIRLRNKIYEKELEVSALKIQQELLTRHILSRQLHISTWHSSSTDKKESADDED